MRKLLILLFSVSLTILVTGVTASAQTASDYRFLEVSNTASQPLADATVETVGSGGVQTATTDAKGAASVQIIYGDYNTRAIKVEKTGYVTEEVPVSFFPMKTSLDDELPPYDPHRPIRVVLLRQPTKGNDPDEAERRKRELIAAVRNGWGSLVTELIHAGVSPDTVDQDGIPVILWASVAKYPDALRALLAAGAEVKKRDGLASKALLYYLLVHFQDPDLDLVRELIRSGADVNARNRTGITPLSAAEYTKNAQLIELIKKAGAK